LRREQVGVHDNFFDLGGNSLLVMQLLSRVQSNFGLRVSASEFFNHPTIEGLAEAIETTIIDRSDPSRIDELLDLLECADGQAF
jgi:aryl carrier-like protein